MNPKVEKNALEVCVGDFPLRFECVIFFTMYLWPRASHDVAVCMNRELKNAAFF